MNNIQNKNEMYEFIINFLNEEFIKEEKLHKLMVEYLESKKDSITENNDKPEEVQETPIVDKPIKNRNVFEDYFIEYNDSDIDQSYNSNVEIFKRLQLAIKNKKFSKNTYYQSIDISKTIQMSKHMFNQFLVNLKLQVLRRTRYKLRHPSFEYGKYSGKNGDSIILWNITNIISAIENNVLVIEK